MQAFENIELVGESAAIQVVNNFHPDKRVEDNDCQFEIKSMKPSMPLSPANMVTIESLWEDIENVKMTREAFVALFEESNRDGKD